MPHASGTLDRTELGAVARTWCSNWEETIRENEDLMVKNKELEEEKKALQTQLTKVGGAQSTSRQVRRTQKAAAGDGR